MESHGDGKPCAVSWSTTNRSLSPASRSFRVDAAAGMEPRQQDPYGVFAAEGSIPRDIGPYKNLVRFTSASLNPKCISSSSSFPLLKKLWELISLLQTVDLGSMTEQQKLAFWINMYNACLMHVMPSISSHSKQTSIPSINYGPSQASLNIGGNMLSPQAIEHYILSRPSSSAMSEMIFHCAKTKTSHSCILWRLKPINKQEPSEDFIRDWTLQDRFCRPQHFIRLCHGTHSSQQLVRIYTADGVRARLERSKVEYLQAAIVVTTKRKIGIPELLVGEMVDLTGDMESLAECVCHQLLNSGSLRKSMVE
ncbi:hypothetical protein MLD38_003504 [Melastoma candidum]|uniref:Uncharacterized protein n=1 Tax=Melastoma candidum TaxID=119954 RepID=A0ACB9S2N6_9MYRT|nr:hypothetical protein MLD38_003504 [Melastoma candidum]